MMPALWNAREAVGVGEYSTTGGTSGRSKAGSEGSTLAPLFSASSGLAAGSFFSHIK